MLLRQAILRKAPFVGAFFFVSVLISTQAAHAESGCLTQEYDEVATLEKVYDGDTIKLTDGRKVRIIAINAPEMGHYQQPEQAYAEEARDALRDMFSPSRVVKLKFGKDKKDRYKRVLAHVFSENDQNVAAQLLKRGLGFAVVVPPNAWKSDCYFSLENEARLAKRAIWSHPNYLPKNPLKLSANETGFQVIEGRVTGIGRGKKTVWLDMGTKFALRVNRHHLRYFGAEPILELEGKRIRVRGWVSFYNDKLRMSLKHPSMIKVLD